LLKLKGPPQLAAPDFLETFSGTGMERYPSSKLAAEIHFYYLKNSVQNRTIGTVFDVIHILKKD